MQKERVRVFVGTSIDAGDRERDNAAALSVMLWQRNFLPIMPFAYETLCDPSSSDYKALRMQLLSECCSSMWVGVPTQEEALFMAQVHMSCDFIVSSETAQ